MMDFIIAVAVIIGGLLALGLVSAAISVAEDEKDQKRRKAQEEAQTAAENATKRKEKCDRQSKQVREEKEGRVNGLYFSPDPRRVESVVSQANRIEQLPPLVDSPRRRDISTLVRDAIGLAKTIVRATGTLKETHRRSIMLPLLSQSRRWLQKGDYDASRDREISELVEQILPSVSPSSLELTAAFDSLYGTRYSIEVVNFLVAWIELVAESEIAQSDSKETILNKLRQHLFSFLPRTTAAPPTADARGEDDPYIILDVRQGCSPGELSDAWRKATKQWHPDRLNDMAPELKRIANDRLAAINQAYETLKQQIR